MQQHPILIMDTAEALNRLKIEYLSEASSNQEINGEAVSHIYHVRMITEYLLRELSANSDKFGITVSDEDIEAIAIASSLHDIGKLQIPKRKRTIHSGLVKVHPYSIF